MTVALSITNRRYDTLFLLCCAVTAGKGNTFGTELRDRRNLRESAQFRETGLLQKPVLELPGVKRAPAIHACKGVFTMVSGTFKISSVDANMSGVVRVPLTLSFSLRH